MHKVALRVRAWGSGLIVAAVLSACGGGDDSAPPPPPAPVAPTAIPDNLAITVPPTVDSTVEVAFANSAGLLNGLKFQWDFGDGSSSTDVAPTHSYAKAGDFDVVLKVTNQDGTTRETRTRVAVTNVANVRGLECSGAANAGWCWQNPRPTGNRVNTVYFVDGKTGWRGGDAGEIFKTTDGGVTWVRQVTGLTAAISSIRFADARNGWAIGAFGAFLRTTDGGSTWTLSKVGDPSVAYDSTSLTVVDASTIYIGRTANTGYSSAMLVSTDGGVTWRTVSTAPYRITAGGKFWDLSNNSVRTSTDRGLSYTTVLSVNLSLYSYNDAISFIAQDDQRAALFTRSSVFDYSTYRYKDTNTLRVTTDGGETWTTTDFKSANPVLLRLLSMSTDGRTFLAVTTSAGLARSTDGGLTWVALPDPVGGNSYYTYTTYLLLEGGDIVASNGATQLLSTDGGLTWLKLGALPTVEAGSASPVPTGIRRLDATTLLASDSRSAIYISKDTGQSWARIIAPDDTGTTGAPALAFSGARNGFMVDGNGRSSVTSDGGLTWQLKNVSFGKARTVQFINATTGWLVGSDNRPYKTTDGGLTWLTVPTAVGVSFAGIHFQSETLGWSERNSGGAAFTATRDGGKTWTELALPVGVKSLYQGEASWIAVGAAGAIYVSTDAGATWSAAYSGTGANLDAVSYSEAKTAWVVGAQGTVLKTEDAGVHWETVKLPGVSTGALNDIRFVNAKTGWIVGDGGLILKTQDGGKTWQPQASGTSHALFTVQAVDTKTAWITGANGAVLATGTGGN